MPVTDEDLNEVERVAREASKVASEAMNSVRTHEQVCAQRYQNITDGQDRIERTMSRHEMAVWAVVLSILGWMAVQLYQHVAMRNAQPSSYYAYPSNYGYPAQTQFLQAAPPPRPDMPSSTTQVAPPK